MYNTHCLNVKVQIEQNTRVRLIMWPGTVCKRMYT